MRFTLLRMALLFFLFPILARANEAETNGFSAAWRFDLPGKQGESSPAIAQDGTIYIGTFYGWLVALTPEGKVKWQFKAGREIRSSPAVGADGTIYFGSRDRNFYAVAADGKLKWKFATGAWVDSSAAIAMDGTLYFGSHDKHLYAVTSEGKLKWKFDAGGIVFSSPVVAADGTIYFGSHDGNFYALTPDGNLKWKFPTGGAIDASPTLAADRTVYFTSTDGNLYALNLNGKERWRAHTGSFTASTGVLDEQGDIYLSASRDFVFVGSDGKIFFRTPSEVDMDVSPAATANREVIYSIPWLRIGGFNRDHIMPPHWFRMDSNLEGTPNVANDGTIYAASGSFLFAVKPPNPAPPVKSSWPLWRGDQQQTGRAGK